VLGRLQVECVVDIMLFIFQSWPEDALTAVASRFLEDVEMSDEHRQGCIEMCKGFHTVRTLIFLMYD